MGPKPSRSHHVRFFRDRSEVTLRWQKHGKFMLFSKTISRNMNYIRTCLDLGSIETKSSNGLTKIHGGVLASVAVTTIIFTLLCMIIAT